MALFEEISGYAARAYAAGSKKIKNTGKIASIKLSSVSANEKIEKLYAKLGERYYKQHGLAPEPGYEELCDEITSLRTLINANNAAINEIKIDGVIDEVVVDPEDVE